MSIGTYAQLKTAIETWLARTGDTEISANAADLVTLAEARLNRELRLRVNWTNAALTGTIGVSTVSLPSDFLEAQSLFLTTFGIQTKLGTFAAGERPIGTTNGVPGIWAIDGTTIQLDLPCDQAHTFIFRYLARFALSDATPTNWLLTYHPDAYLFSALVEAETLTKDTSQRWIALWKERADEAIASINEIQARNILVAKLRVDPAIGAPRPFNIYTGL
jgi:hypothetical protein